METKHVVLLFGGQSSEYEISLLSAANVYEALDQSTYEVTLIGITKSGVWYAADAVREMKDEDNLVTVDIGGGAFIAGAVVIRPSVVFPVLHGKFGEDGTVQGLLDLMGIPYVGCGVEASALCMDKVRAKRLLAGSGIAVVGDVVVNPENVGDNLTSVIGNLPGPWFVKPSRAGSSVGITKVKDITLLQDAVLTALQYDAEVLVETAVNNPRELEVAVMGNAPALQVSGVGEIIPGEEFYSYDDKYAAGSASKTIMDADLPMELKSTILRTAENVYKTLNCRGLARVDFLLSDSGELYVNEVNTMPGFTNISMFPQLMINFGYSYPGLIDKLLQLALE